MLIRFTVENYLSFAEEVVFSMIPGQVRQHPHHIYKNEHTGIDVLSTALLYGANASGKSNFVKAMRFAHKFIIEGRRPKQRISLTPFRLKKENMTRPARFEFEFIVGQEAFAYGFVLTERKVLEEWLFSITATSENEEPLFERITNEDGITEATFAERLLSEEVEQQFLGFVARGTRPNQLLLTEMVDNNVSTINPIIGWFNRLTIIFPDAAYGPLALEVEKDQEFRQKLTEFLQDMHTGISDVCLRDIDPETIDFLPIDLNELMGEISQREKEPELINLHIPKGEQYLIRYEDSGSYTVSTLGTNRQVNGEEVAFELGEESDGTQRLFDLFPAFYGTEDRVFIIDELERSLHPNLVRRLIAFFLESENDNQLIFTTHESTLLDLSLLRRDEIWFVEKDPAGASTLYSLEDFKVRSDLDIRKGYLHGRFGAIPILGHSLTFLEDD